MLARANIQGDVQWAPAGEYHFGRLGILVTPSLGGLPTSCACPIRHARAGGHHLLVPVVRYPVVVGLAGWGLRVAAGVQHVGGLHELGGAIELGAAISG